MDDYRKKIMKFLNFVKKDKFLFLAGLIGCLFFIVNLPGINYGLPMHLISDEESLIGGAMKMIELKTLIPAQYPAQFDFLYYPPLIPYILLISFLPVIILKFFVFKFSLFTLQSYFALDQSLIWLSARFMTLVFSTLILAVTYNLGKQIFSKRIAFFGVLLLALSFFQNNLAHWSKHWVYATFFAYLAFLMTIYLISGKKEFKYLPGIAAGLGVGASYISALGPLFAGVYLLITKNIFGRFFKILILNCLIAVVLGGGLAMLNYPEIFKIFGPKDGTIQNPKDFFGLIAYFLYALRVLFNQETVILICAVLAILFSKKYRELLLFIGSFCLIYIVILYLFFHIELRYVYFILPALALGAAAFLDYLAERIVSKNFLALAICLILIWPFAVVLRYQFLINAPDTRQLAQNWIIENISDETFAVDSPFINLLRSAQSIAQSQDYGRINARERYFLANYDKLNLDLYSVNLYEYQNLHFWENSADLEKLRHYLSRSQPKYFVYEHSSLYAPSEADKYLMSRGELAVSFSSSDDGQYYDINGNYFLFNSILFKIDRLGPKIEIFRLF